MDAAPYYDDLAEGPKDASAVWVRTADGLRLRGAIWPDGTRGTVFLYPGRTEMVEKYAGVARDLNARGYAAIAVDWRGQGLSDRVSGDVGLGHVGAFDDYQHDAASLQAAARALDLTGPHFLIGHSMGGAIGLRALLRAAPFRAAAFSAPMWGIQMRSFLRPVAWTMPRMARAIGRGEAYAPGASRTSYVASADFADNTLTTDPAQFARMQRQVRHGPKFALGGPSLHWLYEALVETSALRAATLPGIPALAAHGSEESIVDPSAIRSTADRWPSCRLVVYKGARHELLMERPDVRDTFLKSIGDLFDSHGGVAAA